MKDTGRGHRIQCSVDEVYGAGSGRCLHAPSSGSGRRDQRADRHLPREAGEGRTVWSIIRKNEVGGYKASWKGL